MMRRRGVLAGAGSGVLAGCRDTARYVADWFSPSPVASLWTGAVGPTTAAVSCKLAGPARSTRIAVSTRDHLASPAFSPPVAPDPAHHVAKHAIAGLAPDTRYHYAVEVDGRLLTALTGAFKTPPAAHAAFSFAFAGCDQGSGRADKIFQSIEGKAPLFFWHLGDFFYKDPSSDDEGVFHDAFDAVFANEARHSLYRRVPLLYMWSNHDYGPRDGTYGVGPYGNAVSRRAAVAAYRRRVPSPALAEAAPDGATYWTWKPLPDGPVRLVCLDCRSRRSDRRDPDGPGKTMLGPAQRRWLEELLTAPANAGNIFFVSVEVPWIKAAQPRTAEWSGCAWERAELAGLIKAHGLRDRVFLLASDMHACAYDDGTNADYAAGGGAGVPVLHAGPLYQSASQKGGPYTAGPFPPSGEEGVSQYGLVEVAPNGAGADVTYTAYRVDIATGAETVLTSVTFARGGA